MQETSSQHFVLNDLINYRNCSDLIDYIENYAPLRLEDTDDKYKYYEHCSIPWKDLPGHLQELRKSIYDKIKSFLPKDIIYQDHKYLLQEVSSNLTFLKYQPGGLFEIHKDYITGGALNKNFFTINLYLNDLEEKQGGQLNIYTDKYKVLKSVCPTKGEAVIIDMNTYHDSSQLQYGFKYVMKMGVTYRQNI